MPLRPQADSWRRYLEAERTGAELDAEVALSELFTALPRLRPAAGFADRVFALALAGEAVRSPFARRAVRWSLAAALLVVAAGAGLLAPMAPPLGRLLGPGRLLGLLVELVSDLAVRFATGVALWQPAADLAATLARAIASPTVFALLTLNFLLAAGALRGLAVLASKGSPRHEVV